MSSYLVLLDVSRARSTTIQHFSISSEMTDQTIPATDHEKCTLTRPENVELSQLGYTEELRRNRSVLTLLFQTLAMAAIPYGEGSPLLSAIYGGGQLSIFIGWIVVCLLDQCIAISLAELASRYPTSAGPYYWTFQISRNHKTTISFINAWIWLIGNWTITLSVNFGFASLLAASISIYHHTTTDWELLLIFYAVCLISLAICIYANNYLPQIDIACATWTALTIIIILITVSANPPTRHSITTTLTNYDTTLSGWHEFTFFIGLLPAAYTFSAIGMISSMAEECTNPTKKVPQALSLAIPVGGIAGLFFIIPLCATLPPLTSILSSPASQALPYILAQVTGPKTGVALTALVLVTALFCSISITVAASRSTWAVARDEAIPLAHVFSKIHRGSPVAALCLVTGIQMLLGLINLGSSSAFTAFVSVGVIALAGAYAIPIFLSLWYGRVEVERAEWNVGRFGWFFNVVALVWIVFELVLFSMPTVLPVTAVSMNYASVVFVGFMAFSVVWYAVHARKCELSRLLRVRLCRC